MDENDDASSTHVEFQNDKLEKAKEEINGILMPYLKAKVWIYFPSDINYCISLIQKMNFRG